LVLGVRELGRILMVFGGMVLLIGILLWNGFGQWLGRLPGDIRIERGSSSFYFPVVTCLIISIILSLLLALFRR
jgi:uncharacterized membrane protein required for colicin V production